MNGQKETILQFGAGKFLRAFFDLFVQEAAEAGEDPGKVVVVQSTPGSRVEKLNNSGCASQKGSSLKPSGLATNNGSGSKNPHGRLKRPG